MMIRDAAVEDVPAITAIYNDVIRTSDAIWLDVETTVEEQRAGFLDGQAQGHVLLVAVDADDAVLGYGSLGPFRSKSGYWPTVEHSIHLDAQHRGHGIGQALLDALIARALDDGRFELVGAIDAGNDGSIRFHQRNGFRIVGELPAVGRKDGRVVDLVLMQRSLRPPEPGARP